MDATWYGMGYGVEGREERAGRRGQGGVKHEAVRQDRKGRRVAKQSAPPSQQALDQPSL